MCRGLLAAIAAPAIPAVGLGQARRERVGPPVAVQVHVLLAQGPGVDPRADRARAVERVHRQLVVVEVEQLRVGQDDRRLVGIGGADPGAGDGDGEREGLALGGHGAVLPGRGEPRGDAGERDERPADRAGRAIAEVDAGAGQAGGGEHDVDVGRAREHEHRRDAGGPGRRRERPQGIDRGRVVGEDRGRVGGCEPVRRIFPSPSARRRRDRASRSSNGPPTRMSTVACGTVNGFGANQRFTWSADPQALNTSSRGA